MKYFCDIICGEIIDIYIVLQYINPYLKIIIKKLQIQSYKINIYLLLC